MIKTEMGKLFSVGPYGQVYFEEKPIIGVRVNKKLLQKKQEINCIRGCKIVFSFF